MSLDDFILPPKKACRFGNDNVQPSVLLWGDSHAMVTAIALEDAAQSKAPNLVVSSAAYGYCRQYNSDMLKLAIDTPSITSVVLSSRWTNWRTGDRGAPSESDSDIRLRDERGVAPSKEANREIFERGFLRLIEALDRAGKTVWIVGPIPEPSTRVPKALYLQRLGFGVQQLDIPRDVFISKNARINRFFDEISRAYPVRFVRPDTVLCGMSICRASEGGKPNLLRR